MNPKEAFRLFLFLATLLAMALPVTANTAVLYDFCYGSLDGKPCNTAGTRAPGQSPYTWQEMHGNNDNVARDVIGNLNSFDISRLAFTTLGGNTIRIDAVYRYGGSVNTGTGSIGEDTTFGHLNLYTGDILFGKILSPSSYANVDWEYGIKIGTDSRVGVVTGLYRTDEVKVSNNVFLGVPVGHGGPYIFREDTPVWFADNAQLQGSQITPTVALTNASVYEYTVSMTVTNAAFAADLSKGMYVSFASATCANDIVYGNVAVPEPGAFLLMGAVVGALAIGIRRRRKAA